MNKITQTLRVLLAAALLLTLACLPWLAIWFVWAVI